MDIISHLPPEISQEILGYLPVEDLAKCLKVSRKWWEVANCNVLWKRHCLRYDVSREESSGSSTSGPLVLCSWASSFVTFGSSTSYNWYNNRYQVLKMNSFQNKYVSFAFHGNYFAAYSFGSFSLDVYCIVKIGGNSEFRLINTLPLCFPKVPPKRVTIYMTEEFIVTTKCNIALVYIKKNNNFELYKAIGISLSPQFVTEDIPNFVEKTFDTSIDTLLYGVLESYLWLGRTGNIIVLDILFDKINVLESYSDNYISGKYFVSEPGFFRAQTETRVCDKAGNIIRLFNDPYGIHEVKMNDTLICIITSEPRIKVLDLSTGDLLFTKSMPPYIWMKVHPRKEILYTLGPLSRTNRKYTITAWDVRSGEIVWLYETPYTSCDANKVTYWELIEVCGKYLISWPVGPDQETFLCINAKTGEHMFEARRELHGANLKFEFNDNVLVTLSKDIPAEITVWSYM